MKTLLEKYGTTHAVGLVYNFLFNVSAPVFIMKEKYLILRIYFYKCLLKARK